MKQFLITSEMTAFHADAVAYCGAIDQFIQGALQQPYTVLLSLLSSLANSSNKLPSVLSESPEDRERLSHDEWRKIYDALGEVMNTAVSKLVEFHHEHKDEGGIQRGGLLSDDLSDLYRDLQEGLCCWEKGDYSGAVWAWRFHYEIHYGEHLLQALLTIHEIRYRLYYE